MDGPFSPLAPGLLSGAAFDRWFAYNFDTPRGVKLLDNATHLRLLHHSSGTHKVPNLTEVDNAEDFALYQHGLVKLQQKYCTAKPSSQIDATLNVWLNIVDACNLGCFYCYIPELQKRISPEAIGVSNFRIDSEAIGAIAERLLSYCREKGLLRLHIKFAGGEPTLAIEQIDEFCQCFSRVTNDLQVTFGILTNGVWQPEAVLGVLKRHEISVSVSIDGMNSEHDRIRYESIAGRRAGTWAKVFQNVAILLENQIRPYFLYTVTGRNLNDIDQFASLVHSLGCGFRLSLERGSRVIESEELHRSATTLVAFYERLAATAPLTVRMDRDARFAEWSLDRKKITACTSCRGYLAVGRNGDVASCQMRLDEPVGNLHIASFDECVSEFGRNTSTKLLRNPDQKTGGCTHCEFRYVCAGGCPQHTRNVYSNIDQPSPWCLVYGTLVKPYIKSCATHLARRAAAALDSTPHTD
jgi:uncharacterized protein